MSASLLFPENFENGSVQDGVQLECASECCTSGSGRKTSGIYSPMPTPTTPPQLVQPLDPGPVDIIGDVHGEIEPLNALLERLGYPTKGRLPKDRQLVFLGDLVDRGPDSVAVVRRVRGLVDEGALCVLGNHELNILRNDEKDDNEWLFQGESDSVQEEMKEFMAQLPLALERDDLRIVHACWDESAIEQARSYGGKAIELFKDIEDQILNHPEHQELKAEADQEKKLRPSKKLPEYPPMLDRFAEWELKQQLENPVKVLTSGQERKGIKPDWINGKYRYTERVDWWDTYRDDELVVIGHYWRSRHQGFRPVEGPDPFEGIHYKARLGPAKRVMCIDYSIGARHKERRKGTSAGSYRTDLAAYRIHEDSEPELIFSPI